ncbi:MAG: YiiX/YebB-like N1pC/P60 family cysteine hydrolase [Bacteroidota bacterium]
MHKKLIFILLLVVFSAKAQQYQTGDLVFQNLDCGGLCDAIETVTQGHKGQKFSHIGLVYVRKDSVYIIEAIGTEVQLTPFSQFASRSKNPLVHARLRESNRKLIHNAIQFALQQLGKPYDEPFLYDNGKYYCSELIYDAFLFANGGRPFFQLEPMTFKQPNSSTFFPIWEEYYHNLKMEIPEGKPGINPGGISRSDKIEMLK